MERADINQSTKLLDIPEIPAPEVPKAEEPKIIDIQIAGVQKQQFRINGDNNKILELNVSDVRIMSRLREGYTNLSKIMDEIAATKEDDDVNAVSEALKKADAAMREQIDFIFDSNVSEVCCGNIGSMYDPINGTFRWEHIIDTLTGLYANNLNAEYKKMKDRISKYTDKYVGDHKKGTSRGTTKSKKKA